MAAISVIESDVARFLLDWEDDGSRLPSDAARQLVQLILGHKFLYQAIGELGHFDRQRAALVSLSTEPPQRRS